MDNTSLTEFVTENGNIIKWLGHAGVEIINRELNKVIYIDPWEINEKTPADFILITHDHYDHLSIEDIKKISKENTFIIASSNCKDLLKGMNVMYVEEGDLVDLPEFTIEVVPAYNPNKDFHPKTYGGVGFIIDINNEKIYHAGDTDIIPEMDSFKVEIALLPVGGKYTMNGEEAARAATKLGARTVIPIHYNKIVGTQQDVEALKKNFKGQVVVLQPV